MIFLFEAHLHPVFRFQAILGQDGRQRPSASDGSTWSGLWRKMTTLLPFMWPKKSLGLQVRVILCLITLVGVRVANVFVPLYYKKIGKRGRLSCT